MEADLILHVIDASDPQRDSKFQVVEDVLKEIGAGDHPRLTVYNKVDLFSPGDDLYRAKSNPVLVSAVTGVGLNELVEEIVHEVAAVTL